MGFCFGCGRTHVERVLESATVYRAKALSRANLASGSLVSLSRKRSVFGQESEIVMNLNFYLFLGLMYQDDPQMEGICRAEPRLLPL